VNEISLLDKIKSLESEKGRYPSKNIHVEEGLPYKMFNK
jgi:hypothetical protein